MMEKLFAWFMSIIAFITSLFSPAAVISEIKDDAFQPVIRFMVTSDTHINGADDVKLERIAKAFEFVEKENETSNYNTLDAAMFVGDCTDSGTEEQFAAFKKAVTEGAGEDTQLLIVLADHHDGSDGKTMLSHTKDITGNDSDFHIVINGFHFIGISTCDNDAEQYSLSQRRWLREQLREAAKDDPEKPIFVCNHEHIWNTVYGSSTYDGWSTAYFKDILEQYPQVVHFSGHSHYPINDPRSVLQDKCTSVGTGTMNYVELRIGTDRKLRPDYGHDVGQAWLVEVDAQNRVRLRGFNSVTDEWLCDYILPNLFDESTYIYTEKNMKALSSAPAFNQDAVLTVTENGDQYDVTVPKAESTDGKIIFLYRIKVKNKCGTVVHNEYILNNYWQNSCFESVTFTVDAKPGYTVEVTAENAYEMASAPLVATLE